METESGETRPPSRFGAEARNGKVADANPRRQSLSRRKPLVVYHASRGNTAPALTLARRPPPGWWPPDPSRTSSAPGHGHRFSGRRGGRRAPRLGRDSVRRARRGPEGGRGGKWGVHATGFLSSLGDRSGRRSDGRVPDGVARVSPAVCPETPTSREFLIVISRPARARRYHVAMNWTHTSSRRTISFSQLLSL
jgi:hypothetical protein